MKNVLVIVDFQKDFYDGKEGTLYVPGAEKCVTPICSEILSKKYDLVILTLDWHHFSDNSFKDNGGLWPVHCVQHSLGAGIHPDIMDALNKTKVHYETFIKGNCYNHEEYGAFEKFDNYNHSVVLKNNLRDSNILINEAPEKTKVTICGVAGNYCVFETYKNLIKIFGKDNVTPYYEGIAFIGDSYTFDEKL